MAVYIDRQEMGFYSNRTSLVPTWSRLQRFSVNLATTMTNHTLKDYLDPWILPIQPCTGTLEGITKSISPLSSREIVIWLRQEGIPIAVIAEMTGVERKSVYAWLSGGAIKGYNQERLEKIYSLLSENKLTNLRHLYRFWSRSILGENSLATLLSKKVLDEKLIRDALSKLWPLAKKEEARESLNLSSSSIKSNPFLRESREVTTS